MLVRLVLFGLPLALLVAAPAFITIVAGEFTPLARVAQAQAGAEPLLYGRAYRDNYFAFKLISARVRRPDVLVLGSSRAMQFRSLFFHKAPGGAFNAGGAVQSLSEATAYATELARTHTPRVVLLVTDQRWFLPNYVTAQRAQGQVDEEEGVSVAGRILMVSRLALLDWWRGKITVDAVWRGRDPAYGVPALGLNAIMTGKGFRNDGSFQGGDQIRRLTPTTVRLAEGFERLQTGAPPLQRAGEVSPGSLVELDRLLATMKQRGVTVIGLAPPFAPSLYRVLREGGAHAYLAKVGPAATEIFARHGFAFVDFTDPRPLGVRDDDMLDYSHPSEYVALLMYAQLVQRRPDVLGAYSDPAFLERLRGQASDNPFAFLGNRF